MLTRSSKSQLKTGPKNVTPQRQQGGHNTQIGNQKGKEHVELLEYEWPDLPPLNSMEDAVCRSVISRGINYGATLAKSHELIISRFRIDLRAKLQRQDNQVRGWPQFKDRAMTSSDNMNFAATRSTNTWTARPVTSEAARLNVDSETVRKAYVRSAPSGGDRHGLGYGLHPRRPTNSVSLVPHSHKYQKTEDGDDVISEDLALNPSVQDEPGCVVTGHRRQGLMLPLTTESSTDGPERSDMKYKHSDQAPHYHNPMSQPGVITNRSKSWSKQLQAMSYEDLCTFLSSRGRRSNIPHHMISPYLTDDVNQRIWEWLHVDEQPDVFDYFMSVCG